MTTASISGTDIRLRDAVVRQLDWDPTVDASAVGVSAKGGVVTLTGYAPTYADKLAAERSVKRVRGVRGVANDIVVRLKVDRTDSDIARDAVQALRLRPDLGDRVQATVHNGHVTLTGSVEWLYQQADAEQIVGHLHGVIGVFNHLTVKPRSAERDLQRRISSALHRIADLDARDISVAVTDDVAMLQGTVRSWTQREAAERAAASAPGISRVDCQLIVVPEEAPATEPADVG